MSADIKDSNAAAQETEELEDQLDAALLKLARIEQASKETTPFEIVQRLSDGEVPVTVWREHRRLSQDQLAAAAHVQVETLDAVESGKEDVPLRMMHALGGALRVDLDDLVPWTQEIDAVAVRETQVR